MRWDQQAGTYRSGIDPDKLHQAQNLFVLFNTARTAQRIYQATGDWELAARSAGRAYLRWTFYAICALTFHLVMGGVLLFMAVPVFVLRIVHVEDHFSGPPPSEGHVVLGLVMLAVLIVAYLWSIPYVVGGMWVRNADRSLYRVNHLRIYRWFVPFAYRIRRFPDWAVYSTSFILGLALSYVVPFALG